MDSGEDEIDVGTNADSLIVSYANNSSNGYGSLASPDLSIAGMQNDHHFSAGSLSIGELQSPNGFAVPQQSQIVSEADRKRAHHNALERKRRDHIKDSFHTLRDAIPNIKGEKVSERVGNEYLHMHKDIKSNKILKTSRAQILKAATDYIKTMKNKNAVFQNDIDALKKQNYEIEIQIRQLEKAKQAAGQLTKQQSNSSNSNIFVKSEPSLLNLSDSTSNYSSESEFKFDLNENISNLSTNPNMLNTNNVLILTKQSNSILSASSSGMPKKIKTIVNTKTNGINSTSFL